MITHVGRMFYLATCLLAGMTVIYATAFLFTPYNWEIFPRVPRLEPVLAMTAFAGLVWGLGRTVYHFTRK